MCGIFGAVGVSLSDAQIGSALEALGHRGPDGSGHRWDAKRRAVFGHTRLAIIDLSPAGAQPMVNEDGTLLLTMNGEVYNHAALRSDLERRGHVFRSACDAEVILHLFEEKGMDLLEELHGMFAFALYDSRDETLYLARDRIGIKPLYYYDDGGKFLFASELAALRRVPGFDDTPDVTAYYDFLTYQFVPAPKTVYRRAFKLPAAHYLVRSGGRTEIRSYWDVSFAGREEAAASASEALADLLARVTREHLVSDVPVGVFLSAGVDSALVASAARDEAGSALQSFTVGFPERRDDEVEGASRVAALLGAGHVVQRFSREELLVSVPHLPGIFGEPFADHSALPMIVLCRLAAARMKVVLSGDGGDETHLGYGRYRKSERRRLAHAVAAATPGLSFLAALPPLRRLSWLRAAAEEEWGRVCQSYGGVPRRTKRMLLDVTSPELGDYDDYWLYREHDRPEFGPYGRQQYLDLKTLLPEGILTKVDRTSMRFGLEVRPPLLDHRMVELAAALPDRLKLGGGVQKPLLRELLGRRLPPEVAAAPKRGFSVPMKHFVGRENLFRLERDVDVFGAFRVRRSRVAEVLRPSQDNQRIWTVWCLARFVDELERGRA